MKIVPLDDRIVVQPMEAEEKTSGGIVIPDTAKEKPQKGKVIAAGEGRVTAAGKRIPVSVKKGDVILYAKYGGTEIKVEGKDLLILRESDILAKIG